MKTLLVVASFVAVAAPTTDNGAQLKQEFLDCDLHASQYILDDGESAYCSEVYEKLKNQYFNGDSVAILDWWRKEKNARTPQ